jgi:hypothetical protein
MKLADDLEESSNFETKQIDLEFKGKITCQNQKFNLISFYIYKQNKMKNNYRNIKEIAILIFNILFLSSFIIPSVNSSNQFGKFSFN